jgi:hypothetical protein
MVLYYLYNSQDKDFFLPKTYLGHYKTIEKIPGIGFRVIVTFSKYKIPGIGLELSSLSANIKFQV